MNEALSYWQHSRPVCWPPAPAYGEATAPLSEGLRWVLTVGRFIVEHPFYKQRVQISTARGFHRSLQVDACDRAACMGTSISA